MTINSNNNNQSVTYDALKLNTRAKAVMDIYAKSNEGLNIHLNYYRNGAVYDFTGAKAYMTVRDIKDGGVIALRCMPPEEATNDTGLINLTKAGEISITCPASIMSLVYTSSKWYYDLLIVFKNGIKARFLEGYFYIDRSASYEE